MVEGPLLSVVVPFYNVEAYLRDCLESLRAQTLTDLEVVLVDDGSPDGSLQVAEEFVAADPRFRLVRQENQGLGPARNTGTGIATGRYLAFVDSDDLVAPRAYAQLVGSLERTGSSFAGGNAYRFSAAKGVYQSWTHREPFAQTRPATTIDAFPTLMRDRMIWNKVYRRSFWDEQGFEFPAIRYEDYPVTLSAYLRATSVDVLAEHVYFWRDRESGDSITQQTFRIDNVRDRSASARLVLDGLDREGERHAEVRRRVHGYFINVDLVALAEALIRVDEQDRVELEQMATELADRLDPAAGEEATRLARLLHRSLRARDLDLVRALARWRGGGGNTALVRELLTPAGVTKLPTVLNAVLTRKPPQHPVRPRRLRSTLVSGHWRGDTLHVQVTSRLRAQLAARAGAQARLSLPGAGVPLPVEVTPVGDGVRWDITIGPDALDRLPVGPDGARLELRMHLGPIRWTGGVRFEPGDLPGAHRTGTGPAHQLRGEGWDLHLARLDDVVLARARTGDDGFELTLDTGLAPGDALVVLRPDPTPELAATDRSGTDGRFRLAGADIVADDPIDDPVTGVAERQVVVRHADGTTTPVHPADGTGEDTAAAGVTAGDRTITLACGWDGALVVRQELVRA